MVRVEERWRRRECITPVRRITEPVKDDMKRLKDILLGISSEIEALQNLIDRFPLCEVRQWELHFSARRVA